jgi:hypothetical protein
MNYKLLKSASLALALGASITSSFAKDESFVSKYAGKAKAHHSGLITGVFAVAVTADYLNQSSTKDDEYGVSDYLGELTTGIREDSAGKCVQLLGVATAGTWAVDGGKWIMGSNTPQTAKSLKAEVEKLDKEIKKLKDVETSLKTGEKYKDFGKKMDGFKDSAGKLDRKKDNFDDKAEELRGKSLAAAEAQFNLLKDNAVALDKKQKERDYKEKLRVAVEKNEKRADARKTQDKAKADKDAKLKKNGKADKIEKEITYTGDADNEEEDLSGIEKEEDKDFSDESFDKDELTAEFDGLLPEEEKEAENQ